MKFIKEWNEYVTGYVLTSDDCRSLNVQFEINRNSNHPEPDVIAVIGAEGDETINVYTDEEQEEIRNYIKNDADISAIALAMTTKFYGVMSDNYDKNKV